MNLFTRGGKLLVAAGGTKLRLCCCPEPCVCCNSTPNVIHAQVPTLTPPGAFGPNLQACITGWSGLIFTLVQGKTDCTSPIDAVASPCIWGACQTCDYDDTATFQGAGTAFLFQKVVFDCSLDGFVLVDYFVSFEIVGFSTSCEWIKSYVDVGFDCSAFCAAMCDADRQFGCDTSFFSGCSNVGTNC